MAKWYLGIDETGNFAWDGKPESSFALAVVVSESDNEKLEGLYRKAYSELKLGGEQNQGTLKIREILKRFHYFDFNKKGDKSRFNKEQKDYLFGHFSPCIHSVIRSVKRPVLFANPQGLWLRSVEAVIQGFFNCEIAKHGDEVHVQMDQRSEKTWGLIQEKNARKKNPQEKEAEFEFYHARIANDLKKVCSRPRIELSISFASDNDSPLVNLADLACGLLRNNKLQKSVVIHQADCLQPVTIDVAGLVKIKDHRAAMAAIFDQCCNGEFSQLDYLPQIFNGLASKDEEYCAIWREICNFYDEYLERRGEYPNIMPYLSQLRDALAPEMNGKHYAMVLPAADQLNFLEHLIGLETHLGATEDRYGEKYQEILKQVPHERATDHWEKFLRLKIRRSQLYFNAYQFAPVREKLIEPHLEEQERRYKSNLQLPGSPAYDLTLAEMYGTLGQSYAFENNYEDGIYYLEQDFNVADEKNRAKVTSFLFCAYLHQKNFEKCTYWFTKQTGEDPATYFETMLKEFREWDVLSYVRLRTLALELEQTAGNLPPVPTQKLSENQNTDYPWPLVLKWVALGLSLEGQQDEARELLAKAIKQLDTKSGKFTTIRTLAIAPYQMLGLLRTDSKLHSDYAALLADLTTEPGFADYVKKHGLQKIWEPETKTMWERATCLPFNYA